MTRGTAATLTTATGFARALFAHARGGWGTTAGLMLLGGVLESAGLILLVPLAGLLVDDSGRAAAVAAGVFALVGADTRVARLATLLALFAVVMLLRAGVLLLRDRHLAALRIDFVEHERIALIRTLAGARWRDVAGLHHARITAAIGSDIQRVATAAHFLLQLIVAVVMLSAQWLLALWVAPTLALLAAALLLGGAVAAIPGLIRARHVGEDMTGSQLRMIHTSGQFLAGLKPAIAQDVGHAFARDFEQEARLLSRRQLDMERRQSLARVVGVSAAALVGAGMLLAGVWWGEPVANLLAAIVILSRMSGPALQIQQTTQQLATLIPAHAALVALHRDLATPAARRSPAPVSPDGGIEIDDVAYAHADGGGVDGVTLRIAPGEMIGLVGGSGAGKTTLLDMLAGLLDPDRGRITMGGVPIDRRHVAYVVQDSFLTNATIRDNLTLGGPPQDDARLWAVLTLTGAREFVERLPAGLDTPVAERGARLSGGERQRIVIARALLRDPVLLILDEATNAIDIAGERAILDALARLPHRPSVIMVAHRTESLARCDRILTLARGRIMDVRETEISSTPSLHPPGSR